MDMDMDIDIDLGDIGDEAIAQEPINQPVTKPLEFSAVQPTHFSGAAAQEEVGMDVETDIVPHKLNIQGVDDLSTSDLYTYSNEHFPDHKPSVEWINDTSVNFVFESAEVARQALAALTSPEALETVDTQERLAKAPSSHPAIRLSVRQAIMNDKKKPRAREASRYYLMHPEEEERNRRRPQRRRRKSDDEVETFEASMYDDDDSALASRRNGRDPRSDNRRRDRYRDRDSRDRSASPGRARTASPGRRNGRGDRFDRDDRARRPRNSGKELFADPALRAANNKAAAGNLKKELFPMRTGERPDETADLFAKKMSLPLLDGAGDGQAPPLRSDAIYQEQKRQEAQGFSIKGSATGDGAQGFSIRGAAGQTKSIKELFPEKANNNAGKELFGGRGVQRRKAADLFG